MFLIIFGDIGRVWEITKGGEEERKKTKKFGRKKKKINF
jgi:hypothetical protein